MGAFYQEAAAKLIDYDPNAPMPPSAPHLSNAARVGFLQRRKTRTTSSDVMGPLLQSRSLAAFPPQGRFQDASRLYRVRLFFRIKGESAGLSA